MPKIDYKLRSGTFERFLYGNDQSGALIKLDLPCTVHILESLRRKSLPRLIYYSHGTMASIKGY